jgi:hypothetical protein
MMMPDTFTTTSPTAEGIEEVINDLPRNPSPEQVQDNLRFIENLGRRDIAARLMGQYLDATHRLEKIASRSYRHVNHFDKLVLVDTDTGGYRLTLHLWRPPYSEADIEDELIHDHRFSFWSNVLTGTLVTQNFMPPDGLSASRGLRQYRYVPEKLGTSTTKNFYEFVGETSLADAGLIKESAGHAYYLQYHRIHRVVIPRVSMTCTMVLRGPRERTFSHVYNTRYPSTDTTVANAMFTAEQVAERLECLRAALEGPEQGVDA